MVFRSGRRARFSIAPLLILVLCGAAAAPFSSKQAYREARNLTERAEVKLALAKTKAALARLGNADDEWTWALRMLEGELLSRSNLGAAQSILRPELPAKLQTSEAAVRRLIALSFIERKPLPPAALEIAQKYQPSLLPDIHLLLIATATDAEAEARIATELGRRAGRPLVGTLAQNALSRHYTFAGRYAEAIDLGEKALATFRKLNLPGRLSGACGNLGWAYEEIGDYERAGELFRCAEASAAQSGSETDRIKWINQIGNLHYALRQYQKAESYYKQALALSRDPDFLTNLARVYADTGRFNEARTFNNEALTLKHEEGERQRSLLVDAQIDARTGNPARAEKTLLGILDSSAKDASRTRWEAEARLGELYSRMQRNRDAETHFKRAIATARATRASIRSDELKLAFFNVVEEVFDAYVDSLVRQKRDEEALEVTEISRAQTLEEGLEVKSSAQNIDPRAIAKQHGVTILCYWLGSDRSYVWTITPSTVSLTPLPADKIVEDAVDAYRRDLLAPGQRASPAASASRGSDLYQMLVAPAVKGLAKDARVTIIADGRLHALSFDTLVVRNPTPHYWIEDVVLTSANSLQLIARTASAKHGSAPAMLLVGNPLPVDPAFPKLENAPQEMQLVSRHFAKRTVLEGAKATPAAYRAAAAGAYDYLHFVAHGVSTRTQPLDSAVILSRDATSAYKLFARDIIAQPLTARLVTISSCHGAGSTTYAGEGLVGLAWAFLRAGAEQVIASLWEVNDNATPRLMDRMYVSIRAGRDPALALRDAKLELVHSQGAYRYARYWAPFVLYSGS